MLGDNKDYLSVVSEHKFYLIKTDERMQGVACVSCGLVSLKECVTAGHRD